MQSDKKRVKLAMSMVLGVLGILAVLESATYLWSFVLGAVLLFVAFVLYKAGR